MVRTNVGLCVIAEWNTTFLRRSRHIEHRYHYLRQQVQNGSLTIKTIPGKDTIRPPHEACPDDSDPQLEGYMDGEEWEAWFGRMNNSPSENAASEGSPVPSENEVLFGELIGPILEGPCWWD